MNWNIFWKHFWIGFTQGSVGGFVVVLVLAAIYGGYKMYQVL